MPIAESSPVGVNGSDSLTPPTSEHERGDEQERRHGHPAERVAQREQLATREPEHEREHRDAAGGDELSWTARLVIAALTRSRLPRG